MTWTYEDQPFTDLPDGVFGFVYVISYTDDTHYIGKKQTISETRLPALKDGTIRPNAYRIAKNINGKRVQFDVVRKQSAWRSYTGSSKLTAGKTIASKTILQLAYSKRSLTYLETKWLFIYEVLEKPEFLNENILGKFFDNCMD